MDYIECTCYYTSNNADFSEILIAKLAELGYESFTEEPDMVKAYIPGKQFDEEAVKSIQVLMNDNISTVRYEWKLIKAENWNEQWEKSFEPVIVDSHCIVRASFHPIDKQYEYDLHIEPKMSFGTGHHETTQLMLTQILETDCVGKRVVDCGCGTGVLAILAHKKGASYVKAFDIDEWCVENTLENAQKNNVVIGVELKGIESLENETFDIILANINRNILMSSMKQFSKSLVEGGTLLISGIYNSDMDIIKEKASDCNLKFVSFLIKNNWVSCCFAKQ